MKASRLLTFLAAALITVVQIVALGRATTSVPPQRGASATTSINDSAQWRDG